MDNLMTTGLLIALMVASFYFLIIRPSRRRQAEQAKLAAEMAPGVRVMLSSGIYGTVRSVGERQAVVQVAPGVDLTVLKQAVLQVITPESQFSEDVPAFSAPENEEPEAVGEPVVADEQITERRGPEGENR